jgi:hypothetical protein
MTRNVMFNDKMADLRLSRALKRINIEVLGYESE